MSFCYKKIVLTQSPYCIFFIRQRLGLVKKMGSSSKNDKMKAKI